jgi:hypothetical protein
MRTWPAGSTQPQHLAVKLSRNGVVRALYVHHLVLVAFDRPCPDGQEARHLNGDAFGNCWRNLAWGTHIENIQDCIKHGTKTSPPRANEAKTHCRQGHPYSGDNLVVRTSWSSARGGAAARCASAAPVTTSISANGISV